MASLCVFMSSAAVEFCRLAPAYVSSREVSPSFGHRRLALRPWRRKLWSLVKGEGVRFRFRKSFKLFPGVRLNLSKRGVGISAGIPGARIGRDDATKSWSAKLDIQDQEA